MFDLNIDISRENPVSHGAESASAGGYGTFRAIQLSGTSNSSLVNADGGGGDCNSNNSAHALNFDIFRKFRTTGDVVPDDDDDDGDEVAGNHGRPEFVTWQLFPVNGECDRGGEGGLSCESEFRFGSSESEWLSLSVPDSGSGSGASEQSKTRVLPQQVRRSRRGPRSRSSQYRGVTFYRRTGRWESHIWDCGKQVYLGGFDTAQTAARAYDRAAIKFRGVDADINFSASDYEDDMNQMKNLTKEELVHILRRSSNGFSRGSSRYRGVALHKRGQWEARLGQYNAKNAHDMAPIPCNGREAVTNFVPMDYEMKMQPMHLEANKGDLGHNLDLNLGISTAVEGTKGNKNVQVYPHLTYYHPANGKRTMEQTIIRANQFDAAPSPRFPNWSWNMQVGHHGGANQVVPLFSSAASSGFSL